jgi:hypothetical protein
MTKQGKLILFWVLYVALGAACVALMLAQGRQSGLWLPIAASLWVLLWGLMGLVYPEKLWKLRHYFSVEKGEPTRFAIIWYRCMYGIILTAFAFFLPIMVFLGW